MGACFQLHAFPINGSQKAGLTSCVSCTMGGNQLPNFYHECTNVQCRLKRND